MATAAQTAGHAVDRAIVAAGERRAKRLWPFLPYSIRLDHPPTAELRPRYGSGRPAHPGLERRLAAGVDRYGQHLDSFRPYFDDLVTFSLDDQEDLEPCWVHPWLIGLDTVSLYSFVRIRRPARYVEVGSGQSTKVVARARRDGDVTLAITSIDPQPRSRIDTLCDRVIRSPLETADLDDAFGGLGAGDIVFFDGSHRVLPNSDCVAFFLDVLPALAPGVLVGIHDIWLPEDYPDGFLQYWWSEQYLLAALLLARPEWLRVELPTYFASGIDDLAGRVAPLFDRTELATVNRRGSVFWLETGAH